METNLWGHPAAIQVGHVACLMIFAMLLERLRRQLLCASAASISTPGSEVVRTNQGCDLTVVPPLMRVREIAASVLRRLGAAQPRLGAGAKADEEARAASKLMVRRVMPQVLLFDQPPPLRCQCQFANGRNFVPSSSPLPQTLPGRVSIARRGRRISGRVKRGLLQLGEEEGSRCTVDSGVYC